MPKFKFSAISQERLKQVHPNLQKVVNLALALSEVDFGVTEGLRDIQKQLNCVKDGTSKTKNGRHLTGHAIDLTPYNERGEAITGALGDDPKNWRYFVSIANAMKKASDTLKIPIEWGGDWEDPVDGYHFQLPWKNYPLR